MRADGKIKIESSSKGTSARKKCPDVKIVSRNKRVVVAEPFCHIALLTFHAALKTLAADLKTCKKQTSGASLLRSQLLRSMAVFTDVCSYKLKQWVRNGLGLIWQALRETRTGRVFAPPVGGRLTRRPFRVRMCAAQRHELSTFFLADAPCF